MAITAYANTSSVIQWHPLTHAQLGMSSGLSDFWSISSFPQNHPTFKQQNSSAEQMDISSEGKSWFMPQWIPKHFVQAWETKYILPSKSEALQLLLLAFNISKISPPHKRSTECVLGMRGKIPEKVYSSRTLIRYFWNFFSPEYLPNLWKIWSCWLLPSLPANLKCAKSANLQTNWQHQSCSVGHEWS